MNKQEYLELRNGLYTEAEALINEGKIEDGNAKIAEITTLDTNFENEVTALANLKALDNTGKITNIQTKGSGPVAGTVVDSLNNGTDDIFASTDYRKSFMNHVLSGADIAPEFKNANANTKTTDIGSVIPTVIIERIVEKLKATGMILAKVTRTGYAGGVSIPTSAVKPVATWVAEGGTSDKQKKTTGNITFSYYKLRCAISVSLEASVNSLEIFEAAFVENVAEAMREALEQAIISGDGSGKPKGILTETPVAGQSIDVTAPSYDDLVAAEGALPLEYEERAEWCMTKKTFMAYMGIKGTDGQPIARINYGLAGKPERVLLGRTVNLCNYLDTYATTLAVGKVFAFLFDFSDYILNTSYNMGIKKYEDNDTEDQITKAVMLVDGKVVDVNSLVTLKKKA